tara:strand:- start:431 stop:946 length:516 start_codon:yes stop_codon:yes gene_type:complete
MIHLNIGSNLKSKHGTRFDNISLAINLLINLKIKIKKISNFYETPSYPNQNFPKFLNVGITIEYNNNYLKLLSEIKQIEKKLGRIKTVKNDPRIIDIDIIDFNSAIKNTNKLILPHPKCHLRNFVLFPILQIDPNWSHPILKKNAQFLINKLSQKFRIEITRIQKNVIIVS